MSVTERLYAVMAALGSGVDKVSRACLYFGVGALRRSELAALTARSWKDYADDDAEVRSGLSPWEEAVYRRHVPPGGRVCVVGCGSGRDLLAFVDMGLDVVGIDPSPVPLARLRQRLAGRAQTATLIDGGIEDVDLPGLFDLIVFSVNVYAYIVGSTRRTDVLRRVARHLTPDGRVIVSYPLRHGAWGNRSVHVARFSAWLTRSDWRPELYDVVRRLEVDGEPDAILYEHFFLADEVSEEARAAGLRVHESGGEWSIPFSVLGR